MKYTIEHAPFKVLKEDGAIEIRHYNEITLVSTPLVMLGQGQSKEDKGIDKNKAAKSSKKDDSAFRRLFGYISGDNVTSQDFSMTAPVFMDADKNEKMSFVLPREYKRSEIPNPTDPSVSIEYLDNFVAAVIRFSGRLDKETIQSQKTKLQAWLSEQNIEELGSPIIAGYDPPSSIPFFRRNEMLIPIQWSSD